MAHHNNSPSKNSEYLKKFKSMMSDYIQSPHHSKNISNVSPIESPKIPDSKSLRLSPKLSTGEKFHKSNSQGFCSSGKPDSHRTNTERRNQGSADLTPIKEESKFRRNREFILEPDTEAEKIVEIPEETKRNQTNFSLESFNKIIKIEEAQVVGVEKEKEIEMNMFNPQSFPILQAKASESSEVILKFNENDFEKGALKSITTIKKHKSKPLDSFKDSTVNLNLNSGINIPTNKEEEINTSNRGNDINVNSNLKEWEDDVFQKVKSKANRSFLDLDISINRNNLEGLLDKSNMDQSLEHTGDGVLFLDPKFKAHEESESILRKKETTTNGKKKDKETVETKDKKDKAKNMKAELAKYLEEEKLKKIVLLEQEERIKKSPSPVVDFSNVNNNRIDNITPRLNTSTKEKDQKEKDHTKEKEYPLFSQEDQNKHTSPNHNNDLGLDFQFSASPKLKKRASIRKGRSIHDKRLGRKVMRLETMPIALEDEKGSDLVRLMLGYKLVRNTKARGKTRKEIEEELNKQKNAYLYGKSGYKSAAEVKVNKVCKINVKCNGLELSELEKLNKILGKKNLDLNMPAEDEKKQTFKVKNFTFSTLDKVREEEIDKTKAKEDIYKNERLKLLLQEEKQRSEKNQRMSILAKESEETQRMSRTEREEYKRRLKEEIRREKLDLQDKIRSEIERINQVESEKRVENIKTIFSQGLKNRPSKTINSPRRDIQNYSLKDDHSIMNGHNETSNSTSIELDKTVNEVDKINKSESFFFNVFFPSAKK